MRPRWRKVLADLWGNRMRSLLVLASIGVGLFALGTIATIYIVGPQDMRQGYAAINPANIYVLTSPFEQGLVDRVQELPGVQQAQAVRSAGVRLEASPGQWIALESDRDEGPGRDAD